MAKIQDIRYRTRRTNGTRSLSQIKYIVRHHSATTTGHFDSFWRHWNGTNGWGTGGYHEIILRDGTVQLCYDPHEITNGAAGQNTPSYHICVVGNGSFTEAQEKAWDERVKYNMDRLNVGVNNVKGHRELPGQSTTCPGINMNTVRYRIRNNEKLTVKSAPKTKVKSVKVNKSANKLEVDGYWGKFVTMALQRFFGTPVDGELWGQYSGNQATQAVTCVVKFGKGGSPVIKALQKFLNEKGFNLVVDGILGAATVRALQAYLGTPVDGEIWQPSTMVKEMQRRLNNGNL